MSKIYSFKTKSNKSELRRVIDIANLKGISKSTLLGSKEFVVHVDGSYDYRYTSGRREEIIQALQAAFLSTTKKPLPRFGIKAKDLREFTTK